MGMKITCLAVLFVVVVVPARAADKKFGAGVVLGVPFGVTAKYRLDKKDAIQSHMGVSDGDFTMSADYLKHFDEVLPRKVPGARVPLYAGLGLKLKTEKDTFVGIRFVGGVALIHSTKPYEFFAEIAPVLRLSPSADGAFDGAVGFRRYF